MEEQDDIFGGAMTIGSETTEAEKEFEKILELLRDAEGLKMYADVYTKLYDTYYKVKDEKAALQDEMNTLRNRVNRFDDTITDYQKEIHENQKTIEKQNLEIEEARKLADAMHARELNSVEALETMKRTVVRLEKELDARKRAGDDETGGQSAAKEKEKFEKEKAKLTSELDSMKQRLANAINFQQELDAKCTAAEEQISKYEEMLEDAEHQAVRTNRLVDHLKSESASLKLEVEFRGNTISGLSDKLAKAEKTIERREKQIKNLNAQLEQSQQEQEAAINRANQFRTAIDNMKMEFEENKKALVNTTKELKNTIDDSNKVRAEVTKLNKSIVIQSKKFQHLEHAKADIEADRERLRQQITVMEREIMLGQRQAEIDKREIENMNREKEIFNKNLQKIQNEAIENLKMLQMQEQHRKQLDHELELTSRQINKQRLIIRQYEKEKDRLLEETIALNEKVDEITEEVRLREADIVDLKKALREERISNRKLTVALDTTRTERNMLHKNYTEALDEIQDLKQKLKMLAYQIEQLKEDITGKETGLKTCEASLNKCHKKTEQLRNEIQMEQTKLSEARADISALRQEEARLNRIVNEGDAARAKLLKDLEGLMNERDVVGAQLVRRNDEISLLYEKIRILEVTLHRGKCRKPINVRSNAWLAYQVANNNSDCHGCKMYINNNIMLEFLTETNNKKR
ncbi:cilia- and flagella-associated protein 58-like [Hyposmocoma kahamanoa]|uniref:cilia- and flagella-associated protein 58-like n=1 Tax=Hyposmocoma kahamanoa TaxID=1477025 RepID=UPI000E6D9405|nr:cilia- and flagella-associated protein 58-like [Hyposmocoma kahamanoa]